MTVPNLVSAPANLNNKVRIATVNNWTNPESGTSTHPSNPHPSRFNLSSS